MGEDVLLTHRLFSLIPKVVHVPEAFVHYVKYNSKSYNGNISKKSLYDTFFWIKYLTDFYTKAGIYAELYEELCKIRIKSRLFLMEHSRGKLQRKWNSLYSDIGLKDILKYSSTRKEMFASLLVALHLLPILNACWYIRGKISSSGRKHKLYTE